MTAAVEFGLPWVVGGGTAKSTLLSLRKWKWMLLTSGEPCVSGTYLYCMQGGGNFAHAALALPSFSSVVVSSEFHVRGWGMKGGLQVWTRPRPLS